MIGRGIAWAGTALAVAVIATVHVTGVGRVDPVAQTVSDYVALPDGAALLGLAAAGLIAAGLAGAVTVGTPARRLLLVWVAAVLLVAVFPTNLPGQPPDVAAFVHRWAGALVFTLPPVAGAVAARTAGPRRVPLLAGSVVAAVAAGAFLLSHVPHVLAGADAFGYLGLVERVAYAALLVLLVVVATPGAPERAAAGPAPAAPVAEEPAATPVATGSGT